MHHKRLKVEALHLPRTVINAVPTNQTVPTTPPATAQQQHSGGVVPLPIAEEAGAGAAAGETGYGGSGAKDKIQAILDRHGHSFCEELGVRLIMQRGL
jgi:hypothetical protein